MVAMQRQWPLIAGALVFACVVAGGSVWWYRAVQARKSQEAARAEKEAAAKAAAAAIPHGEIRLQGLVSAEGNRANSSSNRWATAQISC